MATLRNLIDTPITCMSQEELFNFTRSLRERRRFIPTAQRTPKKTIPSTKKVVDISTMLDNLTEAERLKILELLGGQEDEGL